MSSGTKDNLIVLRTIMLRDGLDAIYFHGTDPHMSEYLSDHWQVRSFLSGFTGSFGEIVITREEAILWTDTRYFLQAEGELEGSGFRYEKLRVPGAVSPGEWLYHNLPKGGKLGIDPFSLPLSAFRHFSGLLKKREIAFVFVPGLLDSVWLTRPPLIHHSIWEMPSEIAGETRKSKLERISEYLQSINSDLAIITALDDLAWSFNLRGSDILFNPTFLGFAVTGPGETVLFVGEGTIDESLQKNLDSEGIKVMAYEEIYSFLSGLSSRTIFLDPATVNTSIHDAIPGNCMIVEGLSIVAKMKSVKNSIQIEGYCHAMRNDGVAMVELFHWLKENVGKPGITEHSVGRKVASLRAKQDGFLGESFAPIVGYGDHGAVVHLSVGEADAKELKPEGLLLIDSGGHYLTGTTDITRTVAIGPVSDQQKADFTYVLKGMIALSSAVFPSGTKGVHLDILARQFLWQVGLNYGHGTGHGVGHCLNVHEGPAAIRQDFNPVEIVPGMVFSNEPGLYRTGEYGIRTENMMVCIEKSSTEFGNFFGFETLTLCPIDKSLIKIELLSSGERTWLNNYHQKVKLELSPLLPDTLQNFLMELCTEL